MDQFEFINILERSRFLTGKEGSDPMVAATLVLASAVKDAGYAANMLDSDGQVNVRVSGDIETASGK